MTRFKSQSRQAVGIVLSHNEYGLVHESLKASIKSFKSQSWSVLTIAISNNSHIFSILNH